MYRNNNNNNQYCNYFSLRKIYVQLFTRVVTVVILLFLLPLECIKIVRKVLRSLTILMRSKSQI